jgi:hypothetical protein
LHTPKFKGKFFLDIKDFHFLEMTNKSEKLVAIRVGGHDFSFTVEQAILLSQAAIKHYRNDPAIAFEILTPNPESEKFVDLMNELQSIFTSQFSIEINKENQ